LTALVRTVLSCSLAMALATGRGNERPRVPEFAGGWAALYGVDVDDADCDFAEPDKYRW
jgi:hypothetical protein